MSTPKSIEEKRETRRKWLEKNKEHLRECAKLRWQKIKSDPDLLKRKKDSDAKSLRKNAAKRREYDRNRDPVKLRARDAIRDRVYHGRLKRKPCEKCGAPESQAHHEDYAKPLDIRWLCPACHRKEHDAQKEAMK